MTTVVQNKRLWSLLTSHELNEDNEGRAKLASYFSDGRTTHTSELTECECEKLIKHLADTLKIKEATMNRLRWRLWFVFAESKYADFKINNDKKKPNYTTIDAYCVEHWDKKIGQMTQRELTQHISIVKKWK